MSSFRFLLFSIVTTFLVVSSIPFSSSFRDDAVFPTHQTSGQYDEGNRGVVVSSWVRTERFLADNSSEPEVNSTLLLAANRTNRGDPLNNFKKYTGGWNISNRHYWASVGYTAVPFFLLGGICVGCVVLYTGQGLFRNSTINTLEYVVQQANTTSESLRNVSEYLSAAKKINVDQVFLPSNVQMKIDQIQNKINSSANMLSSKTEDNSEKIKNLIEKVLVIAGWILVTGTFILCGIFLLLHKYVTDYFLVSFHILVANLLGSFLRLVTGDTCVAMNQWVQHPMAHTALDDILPCVDNATAQETLTRSKEVWNGYVCQTSSNGICVTQGRVTPAMYGQMAAAVNVSYGLYTYGPFLVNLEDCSFVRQTFSDINTKYCPDLRRYSQWIYIGLVMVATAVMLSLVFWVIYGRERRHRVYTKDHMPRFDGDKYN
ncbi:hypothetical protein DH2020_046802 [Rehmannia glutinosa]|uniref:Plasma membrane fusion protein PRM1 n=1 Tax=Rehmannia glutinosa TaxID=99300 RepID=A0ABR0UAD4_REHGL